MNSGEKIKKIRKEKGITQKQLADILGIKQSSICDLENKKTPPKTSTLSRVADALGVPLVLLLDDDLSADSSSWSASVAGGTVYAVPISDEKEAVSFVGNNGEIKNTVKNRFFSDVVVDLGEKKVLQRGGEYVRTVNDSPVPIDSDTYKPLWDLLRDMRMWEEEDIKKIIEYAEILRFWKDYSILKK